MDGLEQAGHGDQIVRSPQLVGGDEGEREESQARGESVARESGDTATRESGDKREW